MTSITLPSTLKTLGTQASNACKGLTTIITKTPYLDDTTIKKAFPKSSTANFSGTIDRSQVVYPPADTDHTYNSITWRITNKNDYPTLSLSASTLTKVDVAQIATLTGCGIAGIKRVELTGGLTAIPEQCFKDWNGVEEITFPTSLATLGVSPFWNCTSLKKLDFTNTAITDMSDSRYFDGCTSLRTLKLPSKLEKLGYFFGYIVNGRENGPYLDVFIPHSASVPSNMTWGGGNGSHFGNIYVSSEAVLKSFQGYTLNSPQGINIHGKMYVCGVKADILDDSFKNSGIVVQTGHQNASGAALVPGGSITPFTCSICGSYVTAGVTDKGSGTYEVSIKAGSDKTFLSKPLAVSLPAPDGVANGTLCKLTVGSNEGLATVLGGKVNLSVTEDSTFKVEAIPAANMPKVESAPAVTEVPAAIKDKFPTVANMKQTMEAAANNELAKLTEAPVEGTQYYEVSLKNPDGTPMTVPAGGLTLSLGKLPAGADASKVFTIIHMIDSGAKAGQTETVQGFVVGDELFCTVYSLSPFLVAWSSTTEDFIAASNNAVPAEDPDAANRLLGAAGMASTGDNNGGLVGGLSLAAWLGAAGALGCVVCMVRVRRRVAAGLGASKDPDAASRAKHARH